MAAYIRTHPGSAPTVKQHLAAIRMLGDWLVVSQVLAVNPAAAVRGPKHVVTKGATPVLSPAEARKLLGHLLKGHIQREERQLFEQMQTACEPGTLETLGADVAAAHEAADPTCRF